jgi:multiple sugar transport system permease protein
MVASSLMPEADVMSYPPKLFPRTIVLKNYADAWVQGKFARLIMNSTIITVTATLSVIITSSMAAYSMVIIKVKGSVTVLSLALLGLIIPGQTCFIPVFLLASRLKLIDTYLGVMLPYLTSAFGVFLLHQFFKLMPMDLIDAARIDGLGEFRIITKVVMPLSVPGLVTLGIFSFMGIWKDFFWPFLLLNSADKRTVPLGLRVFYGAERIHFSTVLAGTTIAMVPLVIIFLIFQRQFVQGIALSGMKQ